MALREILARFGFDVDDKTLKAADERINGLANKIGKVTQLAVGMLPVAAIGAVGRWVSAQAVAADQTVKAADALGLGVRRLAQWDHTMQSAGATTEQSRVGLRTFAKQVGEAAAGNEDLGKTLRALGVRTRDAAGQVRPLSDVLGEAVLGLGRVESEAKRAALAEKLFGEAGLAFVRVGMNGAEALAAQRREFDELNGGRSFDQYVEDVREAARAQDRWRVVLSAFVSRVTAALLPALTRALAFLSRLTTAFLRAVEGTEILRVGLAVLGAVAVAVAVKMLAAFLPLLAPLALIALKIAAIVLVVEDLYQLFTGGDSVIGRLIDRLFGVGAAQRVVAGLRDAFDLLIRTVRRLRPALDAVLFVFALLGKALSMSLDGWRMIFKFIVAPVWRRAVDGLAEAIEFVVNLVERLADRVTSVLDRVRGAVDAVKGAGRTVASGARGAVRRVGSFLGFGGAEANPNADPVAFLSAVQGFSAALTAPSTATLPARAAGGGSVVVNSPVSVQVNGANASPTEIAREVRGVLDRREQEQFRRAREALAAR